MILLNTVGNKARRMFVKQGDKLDFPSLLIY